MAKTKENRFFGVFKDTFLILKKTYLMFLENQGFVISSGLALKTIFALLPALIIITSILKTFHSFAGLQDSFMDLLKRFIVPSSYDIVVSWINEILNQSRPLGIISFFVFIYLSIDLLITLDKQVDRIWMLNSSRRSFIQKVLKYWALLSATPILLGSYFYYSGLIRTVLKPLAAIAFMNEFIYSSLTFVVLTAFFFFAYFIIPNSKVNIFKALIVSSVIAMAWIILRFLFIYYTMMAISRLSILYGSVAVLVIFIFWTTLNWNVLLFGIEFLCVWQNRLYKSDESEFQELFLFDVAFISFILEELNRDFKSSGDGLSILDFTKRYMINYGEVRKIFGILENEGYILCDKKDEEKFYLRKSINKIKLSEIESLVFNKLLLLNARNIPRLRKICMKLNHYYFKHKNESVVTLSQIIS